jgi:hypothetical protein
VATSSTTACHPLDQPYPTSAAQEIVNIDGSSQHHIEVDIFPSFPEINNEIPTFESESASSNERRSDGMVDSEDGNSDSEGLSDVLGGTERFPERATWGPQNYENDPNNVRFAYRESTWSKEHSTFDLEPRGFVGGTSGTTEQYYDVPSFMHLFRKFWPLVVMRKIRDETNRYASSLDENGKTVKELEVYISVSQYMGMKRLPNVKAYWAKSEPFFNCSVIGRLLTWKRYLALTRCLHVTDPATYTVAVWAPNYDKMHQT